MKKKIVYGQKMIHHNKVKYGIRKVLYCIAWCHINVHGSPWPSVQSKLAGTNRSIHGGFQTNGDFYCHIESYFTRRWVAIYLSMQRMHLCTSKILPHTLAHSPRFFGDRTHTRTCTFLQKFKNISINFKKIS